MKIFLSVVLGIAVSCELVSAQVSNPLTVIELFTSQGCSSCPAADELLNKLAEQKDNGVIALSFHVSYWNYLGWKDPYSSEQFTDRQRQYASVKKLNNIYTPQMIVDGRNEFVGSDRSTLTNSLKTSKTRKPEFDLTVKTSIEKTFLKVNYSVEKNPSDEVINFAIVEKLAQNFVPRGENSGMTLTHHNVVRKFEIRKLMRAGEIEIALPTNFDPTKSLLVVYIQNKSLEISGAAELKL